MDVDFRDESLARVCSSDSARAARYGPDRSAVLRRRLGQLVAVARLSDMRAFAAARMRTATTCRGHTVLIAVDPTLDLVLHPHGPDVPVSSPLDESAVTCVVIDDVVATVPPRNFARSVASASARKRTIR